MVLHVFAGTLSEEIANWAFNSWSLCVIPGDSQDHFSQVILIFRGDGEPQVSETSTSLNIGYGQCFAWIHVAGVTVSEVRVGT